MALRDSLFSRIFVERDYEEHVLTFEPEQLPPEHLAAIRATKPIRFLPAVWADNPTAETDDAT